MNIIEKYSYQSNLEFSVSEKEVLKGLIKIYDSIPNLTIKELSNSCYTSTSSLHRLIKKLGFKGFSDFKYKVTDDLELQTIEIFNSESYFKKLVSNIEMTKRMNEKIIIDVANIILKKKKRYCFGTGWKQKQIADNFSTDLLYYGESFTTLRTIDDLKIASEYLDEDSLILIVSISGNANGFDDSLKKCKLNDVIIVSITIDIPNKLSSLADFSLYYKDDILNQSNKHWNSIPLNFLSDYLIETIIDQKRIIEKDA